MNQADSSFKQHLGQTGEIGTVAEVYYPVVYVSGLPGVKPDEVVLLETGQLGQVISLNREYAEVILLSQEQASVGVKVARTGEQVCLEIGDHLMGQVITPLGESFVMSDSSSDQLANLIKTPLDRPAPSIDARKNINQPFDTGVSLVDTIVPIARGQRELILGDRKVGKTSFLKQAFISHALRGGVCIWGAVAKRQTEILELQSFLVDYGIAPQSIIVATSSNESSGLIYQTPYAAMSIAEYFRDQGKDVLVVLDDLTQHARNYREVTLLAKRFPGRSAYPGDIFYTHARLMERAGQFQTGSITCLPVAETVLGDISGYIQTNLMSMTDGHIYFDYELYNQGRRPAINPFLSVTRVGHQVQSPLHKSISRKLSSFLVEHEKLTKLLHFGGELGDAAKENLHRGNLLLKHFDQSNEYVIPMPINLLIIASIWGELWTNATTDSFKDRSSQLIDAYLHRDDVRSFVDGMISSASTFELLVKTVATNATFITGTASSVDSVAASAAKLDQQEPSQEPIDQKDVDVGLPEAPDDSKGVSLPLNKIDSAS